MHEQDRLLVFFSGHGQTVKATVAGETGFLIPYDADVDLADLNNAAPYLRSCVKMTALWDYLENSPAKHALLLADACFSGLLAKTKSLTGEEKVNSAALAELAALPARQVITAGRKGQEALELPEKGHGAFTFKLLERLRARAAEPDQVMLASELAGALLRSVSNLTDGKQTPVFANYNTEGEFLFVSTEPQTVTATIPRPQPPAPAGPRPLEIRQNPKDGAAMVWIPPGTFTMGAADDDQQASKDEKPAHRVTLTKGFWLYRTPVTNAQYRQFVQAEHHPVPALWKEDRFNAPEQPVVGVSWSDAQAYCRWTGCRLPTEAEWEYAARGTDGRRYPWGNQEPDATRAVFGLDVTGKPARVGSCPAGASPFGLLDMAGNVFQWCADRYTEDYYGSSPAADPPGPPNGSLWVWRGGSWSDLPRDLRVTYRGRSEPGYRFNFLGIRPGADRF